VRRSSAGWAFLCAALAACAAGSAGFAVAADGSDSSAPPAPAAAPDAAAPAPEPYPNAVPVGTPDKKDVPPQSESDQPTQLEGIVVTATKRARSVREVPATINALTGEQLESMGAQGVDDFIKLVPGVSMTNDGVNAERISVRGISSDIGVNLTTGLLVGDVPFSDPYLPRVALDPNPFDLADVEVLKGPQGTLFGGTGLNGSIRYVPEAPKLDVAEVKYFEQYKYYDGQKSGASVYGAAVNQPFANDTAAVRLVGFNRISPGYVDDLHSGALNVNKTDQWGLRGMLGWQPLSRLKVSGMFIEQHTHIADYSFVDNPDGQLQRSDTPRPSPSDTRYNLENLGFNYSFDWADFVSQTSRTSKSWQAFLDESRLAAGGQLPAVLIAIDNHSSALTQEFRLASPNDPKRNFNYVVGVFGQRVKQYDCGDIIATASTALGAVLPLTLPLNPALPVAVPLVSPTPCAANQGAAGNNPVASHFYDPVTASELALFGESSLKFWRAVEATVGARLYRTDIDGFGESAGASYAEQNGTTTTVTHGANIRKDGINPKFALSWRFAGDDLVYASASRGFRFGGFNGVGSVSPTVTVPLTFKSDSLWNYELGLRSQWFGRSLTADLTVFYIDWKNPQVVQTTTPDVAFIDNAGGARSRGGEAALRYRFPFLDGLSLALTGAYADTVTTEPFTTVAGTATTPGWEWPLSPKWQTSTTLSYVLGLGSWMITPSLLHTYSSHAWNNIDHTARIYGYKTLDASLSLGNLSWSWFPELILSANNLANSRGLTNESVSALPAGQGFTDYTYIPPRSLSLRIQGRF
jgi:outer membrane receptor protein involved in Fe transport